MCGAWLIHTGYPAPLATEFVLPADNDSFGGQQHVSMFLVPYKIITAVTKGTFVCTRTLAFVL